MWNKKGIEDEQQTTAKQMPMLLQQRMQKKQKQINSPSFLSSSQLMQCPLLAFINALRNSLSEGGGGKLCKLLDNDK
jgi:hypothetical protein